MIDSIVKLLGAEADSLLKHECKTVPKGQLHLPGKDFVERIFIPSDRPAPVLRNLQLIFNTGRLKGKGYVSILPVDQGIEHSGGASFAPNPAFFDPETIVKLAIEGGCNAVASTLGVLGMVARQYAHRIPFILKLNHNELLTYPNKADQIMFASVDQAFDMGCVAVGATIYYGSEESSRQIQEVTEAFQYAHELGLVTILWCYLRNDAFKQGGVDYSTAADLTTDHPIDLTRYQVVNCYMGRAGLINSGGASGSNDLAQAVKTAVINKRAGGMGLISGRKAFQRPMADGVAILNAIQDVYLCVEVTVA